MITEARSERFPLPEQKRYGDHFVGDRCPVKKRWLERIREKDDLKSFLESQDWAKLELTTYTLEMIEEREISWGIRNLTPSKQTLGRMFVLAFKEVVVSQETELGPEEKSEGERKAVGIVTKLKSGQKAIVWIHEGEEKPEVHVEREVIKINDCWHKVIKGEEPISVQYVPIRSGLAFGGPFPPLPIVETMKKRIDVFFQLTDIGLICYDDQKNNPFQLYQQ